MLGTECETLVRACLPYLSSSTPLELVEVCKHSLMGLASRDSDLVWLMVVQLIPDALPPSPHPSLSTLKVSVVQCLLGSSALFCLFFFYSYRLVRYHQNTKTTPRASLMYYEELFHCVHF